MQKVSIIIPAYNSAKYISETIESALNQSWGNKEIIVVDDGSTDNTHAVASKFCAPFYRVIRKENGGAGSARNLGYSICTGDYVQWLDNDDLLDREKISEQMKYVGDGRESITLLSGTWGRFTRNPNRAIFSQDALWDDLEPVEWLYRKFDQNLWVAPLAFLTSRKLIEFAGKWNESLSLDDDGEYFTRIMMFVDKIRFISSSVSYKRDTLGSISSRVKLGRGKLESEIYCIEHNINRFLSLENSERTRAVCFKLLNRWAIYFYADSDLFQRLTTISNNLGGIIDRPKLKWPYDCMRPFLGFKMARSLQFKCQNIKNRVMSIVKEQ